MNRIQTALGTALVAASMVGATAYAGDPAMKATQDKNQVQPARGGVDMKPSTGSQTDVRDMDANAQRAHSPDAANSKANSVEAPLQDSARAGATGSSGDARDWDKIDTDNNNLISPSEMELALKEKGPQAK